MNPFRYITQLYAPHLCVGCAAEGDPICEACIGMLPFPIEVCYQCMKQSPLGRTCVVCRPQSSLVSVNTVTDYDQIAKALIYRLKFERAEAVADIIGRLMADLYAPVLAPDMQVVPMPTASRRIRARGYDQSVLIARSFARHAGLRYTPLLRRVGSGEQKGADRRQRLLQGARMFEIAAPEAVVRGRRILLIDDVITTGATFEGAASVLRQFGARSVGALAFARVRTQGVDNSSNI